MEHQSVRISAELYNELRELKQKEGVSISHVANRAVEDLDFLARRHNFMVLVK